MPARSASSFSVVINYRRDDTAGHAGHLYEDLVEHFGRDHVFMDIDAIEPGVDFTKVIERAVDAADVFVSLIGRDWLTATDARGRRRLDNPSDFVRLEIEAALARDVRLIPVLVQGAEMPAEDELPPALAGLAFRHAHEIRDSSWRYDVDRLIRTLEDVRRAKTGEPVVRTPPPPPPPPRPRRRPALLAGAGAVAALAVGLLVGIVLATRGSEPEARPPTTPTADDGGETTDTAPTSPQDADARILYAANGRIVALDPDRERQPVELLAGDAPDVSPDGRIAFARDGDIWVANPDGSGVVRWTTDPGRDHAPAWSPDGERIAFNRTSRDEGARPDVWIVDAAGETRNLTAGTAGAVPDWSPDGRRLVYQAQGQLFLLDADGAGAGQRIEGLPRGTKLSAAWSPDGGLIAFALDPPEGGLAGIWVASPDGAEARQVTQRALDRPNHPAWSPEGDRLAFTARDGLWVVGLDGSGEELIVPGEGLARPFWAPA